jgi:hypothetical protein
MSPWNRFRDFVKKKSNLGHHGASNQPGYLDQSNQPDHPDDSLRKTRALHAFRSITLMLSLINSRRFPKRIESESTPATRDELKPLDALAAIAIRQHGIAATTAVRNDTSGTLEVLACSDSSSSRLPGPTIPQTSSPTSKKAGWKSILLTLNPHSDPPGQYNRS